MDTTETSQLTDPGLLDEIERLKFTLDHVGAYVYTKDREGRYTFANAMVCDLFGQPLDKVLGQTDEAFFDLSVSNQLRIHDRRVLDGGERIESEENNVIQATGEVRIYWSVKLPIRDRQGCIIGLCGISTDVTERRKVQRELAEQKALFSTVLENIDAYVYMKDKDRRYCYVNEKTADLYGHPIQTIIGATDDDLLPAEMAAACGATDLEVLATGGKITGEEVIEGPCGTKRYYWTIKLPLEREGETDGLIGLSTDISELIETKNKFHELARFDSLTGCLTRGFLLDQARVALKTVQRRDGNIGLLVIDADHFKAINDSHGHAFGDTYLKALVEACQGVLREGDFLGRMGGDEFVAVIMDADRGGLEQSVGRIRAAVAEVRLETPGGEAKALSISIGGTLSGPESSLDTLLAEADKALYQAKDAGRGCYRIQAPSA
ncbi:MAG: sensor domain-containing diguanylate cyclase [Magnetovibrionaceae bacterium]